MTQEIRFCTAPDGTRLAYANVGQGPPLVKVANWLSHLEYDWNSPVWQPWLQGWSRFHTLYRYDMRGCGLSDWEVSDFSIDTLVGDLETVVDAAGLERFDLFAMSQGGSVAIAYTARHPERVNRIIILGGYLRGWLQRNPTPQELEEAEIDLKLLKLSWGKENPAYRQVFTMFLIPEGTPEQFTWFNNLQLISTSPGNASEIQRTFYLVDVRELAATIKRPTLVLQAKEDATVPFEEGRRTAAQIPDARFISLESKNHILLATEPAWPNFWEAFYSFLGFDSYQIHDEREIAETTSPDSALVELTPRELEILQWMVKGYNNNEIAQQLVLSPRTVRNYVSHIYSKLQVKDRREAITKARQQGIEINSE